MASCHFGPDVVCLPAWQGGIKVRVLVTGATGFIGSHLLDRLMEYNDEIRVLGQRGTENARIVQDRVEIYYGDLNDRASLEAVVDGVDRVLHCAARTGPWGPKTEYEIANVHGLKTLVYA